MVDIEPTLQRTQVDTQCHLTTVRPRTRNAGALVSQPCILGENGHRDTSTARQTDDDRHMELVVPTRLPVGQLAMKLR